MATLLVGIGLLGVGWCTKVHASSNAIKEADSSTLASNHQAPKWNLKPELLCSTFSSDGGACGGWKRVNKVRRTMLRIGGTAFAISYLTGSLTVLATSHKYKWLGIIPVFGPFITVSQIISLQRMRSSTPPNTIGQSLAANLEDMTIGLSVIVGFIQTASVVLFAMGLSMPAFENPLTFRYGKTTTVQINPVAGPGMTGLSISGTM